MGNLTFKYEVKQAMFEDVIVLYMYNIEDGPVDPEKKYYYAQKVLDTPDQLMAWENYPEARSVAKEELKLCLLEFLEMPLDTEVEYVG